MQRECPACKQKFKRIKLEIFRNNLKERHPFFSFPCPHCGVRLRRTRLPWLMFLTGILIMEFDLIQVLTLDMYFLPFAQRYIRLIGFLTITLYAIAIVILFSGLLTLKYEIQPVSNSIRFSRGEKLFLMLFPCLLIVNLLLLLFYSAGYGYQ